MTEEQVDQGSPPNTIDDALDGLQTVFSQQHRLTRGFSHRLRTPLAALRIHLEEALTYPDADTHAALIGALRSLERLQEVVEDLQQMARRTHAGDLDPREIAVLAFGADGRGQIA